MVSKKRFLNSKRIADQCLVTCLRMQRPAGVKHLPLGFYDIDLDEMKLAGVPAGTLSNNAESTGVFSGNRIRFVVAF
jgi:hypothetical protein